MKSLIFPILVVFIFSNNSFSGEAHQHHTNNHPDYVQGTGSILNIVVSERKRPGQKNGHPSQNLPPHFAEKTFFLGGYLLQLSSNSQYFMFYNNQGYPLHACIQNKNRTIDNFHSIQDDINSMFYDTKKPIDLDVTYSISNSCR